MSPCTLLPPHPHLRRPFYHILLNVTIDDGVDAKVETFQERSLEILGLVVSSRSVQPQHCLCYAPPFQKLTAVASTGIPISLNITPWLEGPDIPSSTPLPSLFHAGLETAFLFLPTAT